MYKNKDLIKVKLPHNLTIKNVKFTPKEFDIIACLLSGKTSKTAAQVLFISPKTVDTHIVNITRKLEINGRENIIKLIEESGEHLSLKEHYISLLQQYNFQVYLDELKKTGEIYDLECAIILQNSSEKILKYINAVVHNLNELNIKTSIFDKDTKEFEAYGIDKQAEIALLKITNYSIEKEKIKNIFLSFNYKVKNFETILINKHNTYFDLFLNILNYIQIKKIKIDGTLKLRECNNFKINKSRLLYNFIIFSIILLLALYYLLVYNSANINTSIKNHQPINLRSELIIPIESVLLDRPSLIQQINQSFTALEEIKVVALIGAAGSGKTILARQYAFHDCSPIIWELNAETVETLYSSFEQLAYSLVKSSHDKLKLDDIKNTSDFKQKKDDLLSFVKKKLKECNEWLLIYDNFTTFRSLEDCFPHDMHNWGQGRVLITSQNCSLEDSNYINKIVKVGEINDSEKINLFIKVILQDSELQLQHDEIKAIQSLLKNILSYPLDVILAAQYIKMTGISFKNYLNSISDDTVNAQQIVLEDVGDYKKTRYQIVSLSAQKIVGVNSSFLELLYFISLLDSQSIPLKVLKLCKDDEVINNFIFHLKKYSLATQQNNFNDKVPVISMHRDIQKLILFYFSKNFCSHEKNKLVKNFSVALRNYSEHLINSEDYIEIGIITSHIEKFLSHTDILPLKEKEFIGAQLGSMYMYLGDYRKSKNFLEQGLKFFEKNPLSKAAVLTSLGILYREIGIYAKAVDCLEKSLAIYHCNSPKNYLNIAKNLTYLGYAHIRIGNMIKAVDYLNQSLEVYKKHFPYHNKEICKVLSFLGVIHREKGNYKKAQNFFIQALETYEQNDNKGISYAKTLVYMGYVDIKLGNYIEAKSMLEKALKFYEEELPEEHIKTAQVLTYLGQAWGCLGEHRKAKSFLEQSYAIFEKNLTANPLACARGLTYLGTVYKDIGEYLSAKYILEKGIALYKQYSSQNSSEVTWSETHLGDTYRMMGNYQKAKAILENSLIVYKKYSAEEQLDNFIAQCAMYLGILYRKMGLYDRAKSLINESLAFYKKNFSENSMDFAWALTHAGVLNLEIGNLKQAKSMLEESLLIHKNNFPQDYKRIAWVSKYLACTYQSLGNIKQSNDLYESSFNNYMNIHGRDHIKVVQFYRNHIKKS